MCERPLLDTNLKADVFLSYYWLKDELVNFCRAEGLPTSGGKMDITQRIATYLETGEIVLPQSKSKKETAVGTITPDMPIEPNFVCTEKHRAFFKEAIGKNFSFQVAFQKWLKANAGKTYAQAILAYDAILAEKKTGTSTIEKQFEYNTYIRAFFADNPGKSLKQAILCWNYKKSLQGSNAYENTDLIALDTQEDSKD